jgi:hypothetical protein
VAKAYNQGMKRLFLSIALAAMACLPVAVSAQQAPPQPPTQAQRDQMRAAFDQVRKLHEQFRSQVLASLSPSHRELLAKVAGNLAISDKPDYRAAAQQLDAALSPSEKSAIMNADQQMRAQMKSMMANMPKPQWAQRSGNAPRPQGSHKPHERTAGGILLGVAGGHDMMMGHGFRGGPGGGPPPPQQQQ